MRGFNSTLPLLAALALSACGGEADREGAPPEPLEGAATVEANGAEAIGNGSEPAPAEPATEEAANTIPARFQGVWDYEGGTCALESDLRMEVSGDEILFYESIGIVTAVEPEGEDVIIRMEMEGEGEAWQQATRFSLIGEGDALRLHTSDGDAPKEADDYPSKQCPAEDGEA